MTEIILISIVAVAILLYFLIKTAKELSAARELEKYVAWCVSDDSNVYRCSLSLWHYVYNVQNNVAEKYRITSDEEWKTVNEILKGFCQELIQNYFYKRLSVPKTKYMLREEDFFLLKLASYLEDHQCDFTFLDHEMHAERLSYEAYGQWGGQLYRAEYALTDFALLMHKLFYIAYVNCKNCKELNPNGERFCCEKDIEKIIDTKRMTISRI